jgi:hypothetical protein
MLRLLVTREILERLISLSLAVRKVFECSDMTKGSTESWKESSLGCFIWPRSFSFAVGLFS